MPTPEQWALMALQRVGMATGGAKEIDPVTLSFVVTEAIREAVLEAKRETVRGCLCEHGHGFLCSREDGGEG